MSTPPIYVIRHGETEWNRAGRMQGIMDSPLTETGIAQSKSICGVLAQLGITKDGFDFWCSPQLRAIHTAELVLADLGVTAQPDELLGEISVGQWSGLTRAEINANWPPTDPHEHFLDFYARAPDGDSFDVMWDRVGQVLGKVKRPTIIITHGITSRFLRTRAMGYGLDQLQIVPGGQGVINAVIDKKHKVFAPF